MRNTATLSKLAAIVSAGAAEEVTEGFGRRTAPAGVATYSPAFDEPPAELITALVTDRGVVEPVNEANVRALLAGT